MDYSFARLHCLWNSTGENTAVGSCCPFPGDLPNPGIELWSPALQADSLPSEPLGKPPVSKRQPKCAFMPLNTLQVLFCFYINKNLHDYLFKG